jgi:uncharacterized RDD family membrane protein YckC
MGTVGDVFRSRVTAFIIDAAVFGVVVIIFSFFGAAWALQTDAFSVFAVVQVSSLFVMVTYHTGCEAYFGFTVGKHLTGLVVVTEEGDNCSVFGSVVRNVVRIADVLPIAYLLGIGLILVTEREQRLGDVVGKTVVVEQA